MIVSIREYDKLQIRNSRDLSNKQISKKDASYLQNVIIDDMPVFKWGNRCLIAQQWVGVIDLPDFSVEILPKIASYSTIEDCRAVLTRMLLISNQHSITKDLPGSIRTKNKALSEVIISMFLSALETYLRSGMLSSYVKVSQNLNVVKGKILFNKQLNKNILEPTKMYCSYSKYISNNFINKFFLKCLKEMKLISKDNENIKRIELALTNFVDIDDIDIRKALSRDICFNSTNNSAKEAYQYGKLFLSGSYATINAGNVKMHIMLFDMNKLFEKFIYKSLKYVYGTKVHYQSSSNYLICENGTGRKYIRLRPDIFIESANENIIIDAKWKIPKDFSKESDIYQMNAYSTGIPNVKKVFLIYPETQYTNSFIGDYVFNSSKENRELGIRAINLFLCMNWKEYTDKLSGMFK